MGATSGGGTAHPPGAHEFTLVFSGIRVTWSLGLCVCIIDRCLSFFFGHMMSVRLRIIDSGIFKLFLIECILGGNLRYQIQLYSVSILVDTQAV